MDVLNLKNISLTLGGKQILYNVSMDIWKGHVHAIVGPNGAGKSTLASIIMGLPGYRNHDGKILFEGEDITGLALDERARLGMTYGWQEPARFEGLSIYDFISASAKDKSKQSIDSILNQVGLSPEKYADRSVDKTLSGGERKKVELASILAMDPDLILLDEPDSGIDVATLDKMFDVIKNLKKKGTTILLITHSLTVLRQADHAFLMCHGQLIEKNTAEKIIPYFENNCIPCPHKNMPDPKEMKA